MTQVDRAEEATAAKASRARDIGASPIVAGVRQILSAADDRIDYGRAKLAIDRLIDPALDVEATMVKLDRMADRARDLADAASGDAGKLAAFRKLVYQSGPWNGHRPCGYAHDNRFGQNVQIKLIAHYLETRRGDCVSMPILFLILGSKLGLNIALVSAPNHLFLRTTDPNGSATNLEATSGANPMRDSWIREVRPMSNRAVVSGLYLRTMSRREGVAAMATTVLQHSMDAGRYEEAIAVSRTILKHNPRDALTLANQGDAYGRILRREFLDRYRAPFLVPTELQPEYQHLWRKNHEAFAAAIALGWEPDDLAGQRDGLRPGQVGGQPFRSSRHPRKERIDQCLPS